MTTTDRDRILMALTSEWVTTTGVEHAIRALGSNAKHPRVHQLLNSLRAQGLVERRVEDEQTNGYRRKVWRRVATLVTGKVQAFARPPSERDWTPLGELHYGSARTPAAREGTSTPDSVQGLSGGDRA